MGGKSASKSKRSRKLAESGNDHKDAIINSEQTNKDEEYKVERIVDSRKIHGKLQYKVHWEGYNTDEETWEDKSQLNCDELITEFLHEKNKISKNNSEKDDDDTGDEEEQVQEKDQNVEVKGSKKRAKVVKKVSSPKKHKPGPVNGQDEYEIEKIIEMHTLRNGKHEFLVRWYGFGKKGDTWEPEENIKGTEILAKFLEKVEKAKELPRKELRLNRPHTDRFTAMPQGDKRRQSKRNSNRQRLSPPSHAKEEVESWEVPYAYSSALSPDTSQWRQRKINETVSHMV